MVISKELEKLLVKEGYKTFTGGVISDKEGVYSYCEINRDDSLNLRFSRFQLDEGNLDYAEKFVRLMNLLDRKGVKYSKDFSGRGLKDYILCSEKKRRLKVEKILGEIPKTKE